jgi:hypothetical protein
MTLIVQTCGVVGTLIAATIAVRSYVNSNKKAEEAKKKEQETRDRELETRQAQLLMGVFQSLVTPEMMEANLKLQGIEAKNVEDWNGILKDVEKYKAWTLWASYYQGLGTLVKEKLIDVGLPAQLWGGNVLWFYERYESMVLDCRDKLNWPGWGVEVEFLYNSILEYGEKHPESGLGHRGRKISSNST